MRVTIQFYGLSAVFTRTSSALQLHFLRTTLLLSTLLSRQWFRVAYSLEQSTSCAHITWRRTFISTSTHWCGTSTSGELSTLRSGNSPSTATVGLKITRSGILSVSSLKKVLHQASPRPRQTRSHGCKICGIAENNGWQSILGELPHTTSIPRSAPSPCILRSNLDA